MARQQLSISIAIVFAAVAGSACGGSSANSALEARVSDAHLALVPASARQTVAEAETGAFMARWQIEYTEAELRDARSKIKIARNDVKKARLSVSSADVRRKHADKTADLDKIGKAETMQKVAGLEVELAETSVVRAQKRIEYLEARLAAEKLMLRREEARAEHAKAQGLVAAGVSPPDFAPGRYKSQYQDRASRAKAAIARAEVEKRELDAVETSLAGIRSALANASKASRAAPATEAPASPAVPEGKPLADASEPAQTPPSEPKPKPATKPDPEPAAKPAAKPDPEPAAQPKPEEPAAESDAGPDTESAKEPADPNIDEEDPS